MMKALMIIFIFIPGLAFSQLETWDMSLTEVYIAYNKENYKKHVELKDNQLTSTATMKAVRDKKQQFKDLVDNINKRLTSAFIVIADATLLYDVYKRFDYMIDLQGKIVTLAYKYPYTIPIASLSEAEVINDGKDLLAFMSLIVISYGEISKMKTSSRQIIIRNVTDQLSLMTARLESIHALLKRNDVKEIQRKTGIPVIDFYKQDKQSVENILSNFK